VSITLYLSETGDREIKSGSKSRSKSEIKIKGRRSIEKPHCLMVKAKVINRWREYWPHDYSVKTTKIAFLFLWR
jgi:hypothetical protein